MSAGVKSILFPGTVGWIDPPPPVLAEAGKTKIVCLILEGRSQIRPLRRHLVLETYPNRWLVLTYEESPGFRLVSQQFSGRPEKCERCGQGMPCTNVVNTKEHPSGHLAICFKCVRPEDQTGLVEWGWWDLFGEKGEPGRPQGMRTLDAEALRGA